MARALGRQPGGIAALLRLDRDQWAAIEDELTRRGFVLGDVPDPLSWRAVLAIIRHARPGTALAVAFSGPQAQWGWLEHLAAGQFNVLRQLAWLQSRDGQKGTNRPKPLLPPGQADPNEKRFGNAQMSLAEARAWLEERNGR